MYLVVVMLFTIKIEICDIVFLGHLKAVSNDALMMLALA